MKALMHRRHGLTLLEVVIVIVAVVVLACLLLPGFSHPTKRVHRIHCATNLKQIGLSYRIFANDHGQFPFAVSNELGGTLQFGNSPQVFRHYEAMSNELMTPKVLVCRADTTRMAATNFQGLSNGNISYFVGLGARDDKPERLLGGDRDISGGALSNNFMRVLQRNSPAGWPGTLHAEGGNIVLADGGAQLFTKSALRRQLQRQDLPVVRLAIP